MIFICLLLLFIPFNSAFPDQGKWDFTMNQNRNKVNVVKSLFRNSDIIVRVTCDHNQSKTPINITVRATLRESDCWMDYSSGDDSTLMERFINATSIVSLYNDTTFDCHNIILLSYQNSSKTSVNSVSSTWPTEPTSSPPGKNTVFRTETDGFFILIFEIGFASKFSAEVEISMKGSYGFLSAVDWPLLPFYGSMCLVYVVMGLAWLIVSFLQWRDLLRIQFWIGGVILLGMLEMATFYAEYSSINSSGSCDQSTVLLAELVSCGKRTLARMLVIVVSLGFGIVKPRLGSTLHRVVLVGVLYFALASVEAYMRVARPKASQPNQLLVASFPLALLDSAICWWIFTSLVQTTRTLRLRRNLVKLALYRHFTNTLAFAVLASVIFMIYSIKAHHLASCFKDWKELWIDEAYWKLLFSIILLVIMVLWRPTNNNQRYAFSPLIDAADDDDDDEEEQFVNDAYGVKMRSQGSGSPKARNSSNNSAEEDLKWVEEHIPVSLADTALPILDSDEEIMTTKFELSKMQ